MSLRVLTQGGAGGASAAIFVTGVDEASTVSATHQKPIKVPNPDYVELPEGYTQLEYIESTGTQYIDTGFVANQNTGFFFDFVMNSPFTSGNYQGLFGSYRDGNAGTFSVANYTKAFPRGQFSYGDGRYDAKLVIGERMQLEFKNFEYRSSIGASFTVEPDSKVSDTPTLYLFAHHDESVAGNIYGLCAAQIYSAKFYAGDDVAQNFIPAKRNSDSELGLYDLVNDVFYTNAGTGVFTAGAEVPHYITGYVDGKTVSGVWWQKANPASVVPDGYTQLTYIESTGGQCINTGVIVTADTILEMNYVQVKSYGSYDKLFGCEDANYTNSYRVTSGPYKAHMLFCYGTTDAEITSVGVDYGVGRKITIDGSKLYVDDVLKHTGSGSLSTTRPLYLFALNRGGSIIEHSAVRLFDFKLWSGSRETPVRDFVPAKRNSDSVIGLYDLVNGEFYTNAGSDTFVAGAEIPSIIDGFIIEPIKKYGVWTVTATNGEDTTTQDVLVDAAMEYYIGMMSKIYLFNHGDVTNASGGWTFIATNDAAKTTTDLRIDDVIYAAVTGTNGQYGGRGGCQNTFAIDFSEYSKIVFHVVSTVYNGSGGYYPAVGVTDIPAVNFTQIDESKASAAFAYKTSNEYVELNLTDVDIFGYVWIVGSTGTASITVDEIWLE